MAEANCPPQSTRLGRPAYDYRALAAAVPSGIYECNSDCGCWQQLNALEQPRCNNRVAQHCIDIPLEVYRVPTVGWALRTLVDLPPRRFCFTYAGVVHSEQYASKLGSDDTYYANVDMHLGAAHSEEAAGSEPTNAAAVKPSEDANEPEVIPEGFNFEQYFSTKYKQFVIDAKDEGNVARFANHSCDPNMCHQNVFTETQEIRLPLVAFYTYDYVPAGTPLTWNYGYSEKTKQEKFGCICLCKYCVDNHKPGLNQRRE